MGGAVGPAEILVIFLAILLLFGAKRIPEIARGLGSGVREFRSAMRDIQNEIQLDDRSSPRSYSSAAQTAARPPLNPPAPSPAIPPQAPPSITESGPKAVDSTENP